MPSGSYQRKPFSKKHRENLSKSKTGKIGEIASNWKGVKVGYRGLHIWVQNKMGKANHCERCGLDEIPEGKKRWFQWANKSRMYKRDLNDWFQSCIKCHKQYDKKS